MNWKRIAGRSWIRRDSESLPFDTWCLDQHDTSRDTIGISGNSDGSEYDANCSRCFLGHPHTIALHTANLQKALVRQ